MLSKGSLSIFSLASLLFALSLSLSLIIYYLTVWFFCLHLHICLGVVLYFVYDLLLLIVIIFYESSVNDSFFPSHIALCSVPDNTQPQVFYAQISVLTHRCEICTSCWHTHFEQSRWLTASRKSNFRKWNQALLIRFLSTVLTGWNVASRTSVIYHRRWI